MSSKSVGVLTLNLIIKIHLIEIMGNGGEKHPLTNC